MNISQCIILSNLAAAFWCLVWFYLAFDSSSERYFKTGLIAGAIVIWLLTLGISAYLSFKSFMREAKH